MVVPPSYLRWFTAANFALLGLSLPRSVFPPFYYQGRETHQPGWRTQSGLMGNASKLPPDGESNQPSVDSIAANI
jgi:hypothetical protein